MRFHDLRHSFASNLLEAGVNIVTVSKALGHANVQITLTIYAHAVPKTRQGQATGWRRSWGFQKKWKPNGNKTR